MVTIVQLCGACNSELGTFEVKKENLMLSSRARIWCPRCRENTQEHREMAGRLESIKREVESLPAAGSA